MALVVGAVIDCQVMKTRHRIDETEPGYGFGLPITRELAEFYGEIGNEFLKHLTAGTLQPGVVKRSHHLSPHFEMP